MLSLQYPLSYCGGTSFTVPNVGSPVGAETYLKCVQTAGDGKYIRYTLGDPPYTTGMSGVYILYQNEIPEAGIIQSIDCRVRYASTLVGAVPQIAIWNVPGNESVIELPAITQRSTVEQPIFQEYTGTFTDADGAILEVWRLAGRYGFSFYTDYAPGETFFLDHFQITVNFTLPTPNILTPGLQIVSTDIHSITVKGGVDFRNGVNLNYPGRVRFEWTIGNPLTDTVSSDMIGREKIYRTQDQVVTGKTNVLDRWLYMYSKIPEPYNALDATKRLRANTLYYLRMVATSPDSTTYGTWIAQRTKQFDEVLF